VSDVDELEAEVDRLMQRADPIGFAQMRERRSPTRAPTTVEIDGSDSPPVTKVVVGPAPSDEAVEGLLGSLLVDSFLAAQTSFKLARIHTKPGQSVATRDAFVHQAARLTRACVEVADALASRRDKGRRFTRVEHVHVHAGGQAIVGSVTHSPVDGK
jgi:hypothetical protein